jgi:hypothetical protein
MTNRNEHYINGLVEALQSNPEVVVTFRTKAGTERAMRCSKHLESIPEEQHSGKDDFRLNGDAIICVYDFQNSAWRSFRKDSVISFEILS